LSATIAMIAVDLTVSTRVNRRPTLLPLADEVLE
jgi:hypothetical protein